MSLAANTQNLIQTTLSNYEGYYDQTQVYMPTLSMMIKGAYNPEGNPNGIKDLPAKMAGLESAKAVVGGLDVRPILETDINPLGGFIGINGQLATGQNQFMQTGTYNFKVVNEPMQWNLIEAQQNATSGGGLVPHQLYDYIDKITKNAAKRFGKTVNSALWAASATASPLAINSMTNIISDTPTVVPTLAGWVGGIDASANAYWANYANTTAVTFSAAGVGLCAGIDRLVSDLDVLRVTRFASTECIVLPQAGFTLLKNKLSTAARLTEGAIDMGGNVIVPYVMLGDVPVIPDPDCLASHAYYLDIDKFKVWFLNGFEIGYKKDIPAINTMIQGENLVSVLELGVTNRRAQGVSTAITYT